MKNIKAVIFDLDGVICFTDKFHYLAWKKIADELGIFFDEKINDRLRGVSRMESLEIVLERYNGSLTQNEKEILAENKNEIYKKYLSTMTPEDLPENVKETLWSIKEKGYKIAIGSSSKNAKIILKQLGIEELFDAVSDGTNISKSKPDPEVFVKAAGYLGIDCENCAVVEDAVSGIEAAKAANMTAFAVGAASDEKSGDINLTDISEIKKYL